MTPTQLEHLTPAERDLHARGLADLPASTKVVLEPLRTVAELRGERDALRVRVAALEHQIRENDAYIALYGTGHHRTCRVAKPVPGECDCGYKQLRETNAALAARPEVKR